VICIGCGCDESQACTLPGGKPCSWIHAGRRGLAGICSACTELYPPSSIEPELNRAESSLEIYGDTVPQGMVFDDDASPALSFMEPERPRLILPGDEDFHL
jgi:hypothetical protein